MAKTLHYVFDPLCGWCYGASRAVAALASNTGLQLQLLPSGLFAGDGVQPIDEGFAAYAWSADQRIAQLTGQPFSERYREVVLGNRQGWLDSGPATLALCAVVLTDRARELDVLQAIQRARYVEGQDITDTAMLADLLASMGLHDAAQGLESPDDRLLATNQSRISKARAMLQAFGASGVPAFFLDADGKRDMLRAQLAFSDPARFVAEVAAIPA